MNKAVRRTVVATVSALALLGGFAAVAQAHGGDSNNDTNKSAPPTGRGFGHGPGLRLGGEVIHGEGVVKDKDGKYVTESVQRGKASKVSATSVTLTSDDNFKRTYVLTKDTRGTAKDGATVMVIATKSGSTWTAKAVLTPGQRPVGAPDRRGFRGPDGGHMPRPDGTPTSASPTATT